ncbi:MULTISPECIES: hypothetical protein [unclassified Nostoc]|uniref:hypothetical protein n=1 Tax=unclassified Nostoc TaxID=2593658 RepID=UPI000DED16D0|nr:MULTISPECIES: hypothetical protein [unclassified Nostoc]MBE8986075.1 hypothetical protein [Nostoc sp. LEGE 12450]QHG19465.1 hypothetical protein GJB62_28235 [Nostoc sp. ATCC 53789]RCJ33500.1 hypothetical protein A6V25_11285 [Nostoc sp. ATCC 53789]
MSTFLSGVAVLLSTLALGCSGYVAYEVFTLRQTLNASNTVSNTIPSQVPSPTATTSPQATASPSPASTTTSTISPGQFVQPAFGKKAEVELLSAKRIKDPETGNRDVVNLQMRIRRLATDGVVGDIISVASTTARNAETSVTYKGVALNRSTGSVSLFQVRPQASADAYIWLRVPDGVNNLDIFVPDTAAFKNVPISN